MLDIISYIGWFVVWFSTSILMFIFGLWQISKTYKRDQYTYLDILFDSKLLEQDKTAIIWIMVLCWIPPINLFIGGIALFIGTISGDYSFSRPKLETNMFIILIKKLLKHEYLLDKVSKDV